MKRIRKGFCLLLVLMMLMGMVACGGAEGDPVMDGEVGIIKGEGETVVAEADDKGTGRGEASSPLVIVREWSSSSNYTNYYYDENMHITRAEEYNDENGDQTYVYHYEYAENENGFAVAIATGEAVGNYGGRDCTYRYTYDASGNMIQKVRIANGEEEVVLEREFDGAGHLVSHTTKSGYKTVYTYDGDLLINKQRYYPDGTVWYNYDCTYDENGDMVALHTDEYSAEGNLIWYQDNTFEWTVYENGNKKEVKQNVIEGHSFVGQKITYEYNSDGSLYKMTVQWGTLYDEGYMTEYMPFDIYYAEQNAA